ncbi:MAG: DUF924 family protein [Pseudomonadota bacterium]
MTAPREILAYWLDDVGHEAWYTGGAALDADIKVRFAGTWARACQGSLSLWLTYPTGTLAYIILTDQFPRNMFRDTAEAFSSDHIARAAAKMAIAKNWDMKVEEPARQFFYMPLVHSEAQVDQDRAVRLIKSRMPADDGKQLLHARAHREVIRSHGRFPTRNAALGRRNTAAEEKYLSDGAYGAVVEALSSEPA